MNLIPVGSAGTKTIRKDRYLIDVILNFNKASLTTNGHPNEPDNPKFFANMVDQIKLLFEQEFK